MYAAVGSATTTHPDFDLDVRIAESGRRSPS
jgi:hypothetical protein